MSRPKTASDAWRGAGKGDAALEIVRERLDDDLDTPGAISAMDEEVDAGRAVSEAAQLLGVALSTEAGAAVR